MDRDHHSYRATTCTSLVVDMSVWLSVFLSTAVQRPAMRLRKQGGPAQVTKSPDVDMWFWVLFAVGGGSMTQIKNATKS